MSRRSSTNEERFLTLVQDFPKMAPPIYLSIYPFVSFDPCQVASSFERLISERNGSTTRMRKEGGEKERTKRKIENPYEGGKRIPGSINAGENRYRESRKRVRAVRRKIGEALFPP